VITTPLDTLNTSLSPSELTNKHTKASQTLVAPPLSPSPTRSYTLPKQHQHTQKKTPLSPSEPTTKP